MIMKGTIFTRLSPFLINNHVDPLKHIQSVQPIGNFLFEMCSLNSFKSVSKLQNENHLTQKMIKKRIVKWQS